MSISSTGAAAEERREEGLIFILSFPKGKESDDGAHQQISERVRWKREMGDQVPT